MLFGCQVMSNSLRPHGLQYARLPCPSLSPGVCSIHVHWVSDAIQPSRPLLFLSPAFNLSQHRGLFQWVSSSHQVAKVLELWLQNQSFHWIFRVDFLWDWPVWSSCGPWESQGSFQHHNLKTSMLWHSAFFMVQLSHLYMITGKTIALTIWTFVGKMNLLTLFIF